MRRALSHSLFTILIAGTACGGGSGNPTAPPGSGSGGTMTAQVNGSAWTATITKRAFTGGGGLITVQGQDGSNRIITIVARAAAPGTYSLAIGNGLGHNALYTVAASSWSTLLQGGTGTFTITTFTTTQVTGTFSFTAISNVSGTAPVQVTNGQFDLPIS
jgi:hypothetical protein